MNVLNEGRWDRAVRMIGGSLLIAAFAGGLVTGTVGAVAAVAGAMALGTGIVGWCPAYTVCGLSTRKSAEASCPACKPDQRV